MQEEIDSSEQRGVSVPVQVRLVNCTQLPEEERARLVAAQGIEPDACLSTHFEFEVLQGNESVMDIVLALSPRVIQSLQRSTGAATARDVAWAVLGPALGTRLVEATRFGAYVLDMLDGDDPAEGDLVEEALVAVVNSALPARVAVAALYEAVATYTPDPDDVEEVD